MDLIVYGIIGLIAIVLMVKFFKLPFKILLNGILGVVLLYVVNFLGASFGIHIGINIVTALIAGILGIPGVAALVILSFIF